jgi:hypothetical protein
LKTEPQLLSVTLCIVLVVASTLACAGPNITRIDARDAKIGFELESNGHVTSDRRQVPASVDGIYLEFEFETGDASERPLEFKWYHEGVLLVSYQSFHSEGPVLASLTRDVAASESFPLGDYSVEVWLSKTLLVSEAFSVTNE